MPNPGAGGLVHPALVASLQAAGFYPSQCTIRRSSSTRSATGQVDGVLTTLPGHANIACRDSPVATQGRGGDEIRRADGSIVQTPRRVALAGHYPNIVESDIARIDGVDRPIVTVDHDDQTRTTTLTTEATH